jgi:23S rRNA (cytosine1962-C5)-methyltransferase
MLQSSANYLNFEALKTKKIILKRGKEHSVLRGHPWIFSGAVHQADDVKPGDWAEVFDFKGEYLASGHVGNGSILVRILSRTQEIPNHTFWKNRLQSCFLLRQKLLGDFSKTNAYRLVHGEGDGLPGLIIDIYDDCAVIQSHSHGMYHNQKEIAEALDEVYNGSLKTIFAKSRASMHDPGADDLFLKGETPETVAIENQIQFKVNWVAGQKTGFFLDQRDNRQLLAEYSHDKTVLNTFCYTGGFSVYALKAGAAEVCSVDISEKAVQLAAENAALNGVTQNHHTVAADVPQYLKDNKESYDIVVLDPPAFAKSLSKKHQAVMGYKRLNQLGIQTVKPGGLLFTFSCSQVIDDALFANTVTAAGIEAGRSARILHRLGQGPDHPVNLFHPEGHYLKGLVLYID